MTKQQMDEILQALAVQNNTTPEEVRKGMQEALDAGWNTRDPHSRELWDTIPRKAEKPTLEEFIEFMAAVTAYAQARDPQRPSAGPSERLFPRDSK